jgi:hypothetical protein
MLMLELGSPKQTEQAKSDVGIIPQLLVFYIYE